MKSRLSFWSWFPIYCALALCWAGPAFAADAEAKPKASKPAPAQAAKPQAAKPADGKPAATVAKPSTKASSKSGSKAAPKAPAKAAKPAKPVKKDEGTIDNDSPWTLRNHYSSSIDGSKLYYADDNADIALEFTDIGMMVKHTGFSITFADGRTITAADFGRGFSSRGPFESAYGKGTRYSVDLPEKNGMKIHHAISIHDNRPSILVQVEIENTGSTPLEISGITPLSISPGNLLHIGDDAEISQRPLAQHGPFTAFDKKAPSALAIVRDRAAKHTLAFGALSQGVATTAVNVEGGAAAHADVVSSFSPAITLAPGQKLAADPVWLCYRVAEPIKVDMYYSWTRSMMPHSKDADKFPDSWVSVDPAAGADKLYAAAKEWSGAGVKHALVPAGWESKPGSLQGAPGLYPREMSKVAKELTTRNMTPGITVDPLASEGGDAEWTAPGGDGQVWLNLTNPKAKEHAVARLRPLVSAGFAFFAVAPSPIPDTVLKQFNITRRQAECLAYEVMDAAAKGVPVVAPPVSSMDSELGGWLNAAAASSRMREYGVVSGAVRIDAASFKNVDDSLAAAITLYGGPIELYGEPNSQTVNQLAAVFPRPALTGRPLDAARNAPKLWQVHVQSEENRGDAVVAFPGAGAWNVNEMDRDEKQPVKVWRADSGEFVDTADKSVPASDRLTIYGVTPEATHPVIMGASSRIDLLFADLVSLTWDERGGTLKGQFAGSNRKPGTAYVYVPAGWSLKSGSAGKTKLTLSDGKSVIAIPVETGTGARFELAFVRE
ncbi:MAG: hypothetical protein HZB26_03955 [Candidatus Hydrogenedentes bacterium]|nr:hypothetical protein [Candidatus Hydrogenedentota bacterium]